MKQPQKAAPTAAQSAIIHVAQSAGLSALVSLLIGVAQYLATGNIDVSGLLHILGGGFLTALTLIWKSISTNPNLFQAVKDTEEEITPPWLNASIQKPAPKPIQLPQIPPAQQQSGGGAIPPDYYTRFRSSIPDMATQGYVPAVNLNQQPFNATNQVPPAQQPFPQQGG